MNFSNSGIVLTRDNTYITQEQFLRQYQTVGFDGAIFLEKPTESHPGYDIFPGGTIISPSGISRRVAFIYRIPLGSFNVVQPSCYAFLLVSYDELVNALLTENMREFGSLKSRIRREKRCAHTARRMRFRAMAFASPSQMPRIRFG